MTTQIENRGGWVVVRDGERIAKHLSRAAAEQHRDELNRTIGGGHFIRTAD